MTTKRPATTSRPAAAQRNVAQRNVAQRTTTKKTALRPGRGSLADGSPRRTQARNNRRLWTVGIALGAVVLLAAVVAIAATAGDDGVSADVEQTRDVQVFGASIPTLPESGADPAAGTLAPTLAGAAFDGTPVRVQPGQPTLVVFLAHWCPHCQAEVPVLVDWEAAGQVPAGLEVFGVSTSVDPASPNYPPSQWLEREGFPWPVLADSAEKTGAEAFGVSSFPFFALLDADGHVLWRQSGEIAPDVLTQTITDALA